MGVLARLREALADRYEIEGEAGSGGMATVYAAHDLKHRRRVAIKVLRPELAAALGPDRFLREIETAARLQHPHILPVYDSGDAGGSLYYVMPFVEGETLRQRLHREPQLPLEDALRITAQTGEALAFAHEKNVVHRDIKPENILLSAGTVVVADFGIARAITAAGGSRLTQTGFTLGTPDYMSPEQATSDIVDGRSDQYSLGCVLYEMLAGSPPFHGATAQVLLARHSLDPVPSLRPARPNLPPAIDAAVQRALAKAPADRFTSMRGFLDALAQAPTAAVPTLPSPASPASRRRLARAAAVVGLLGLIALGVAFGPRLLRDSERLPPGDGRPRVALLPFLHLGPPEDRFVADGLTEEIRSRIARISGLAVIAYASAAGYQPGSPLAPFARELAVQYVITGTVRTDRRSSGLGEVRVTPHLVRVKGEEDLWSTNFDASLAPGGLFALQSAIAESVAARLNVSLLLPERVALQGRPTADPKAYEAYLRGNVYAAQAYEETTSRLAVVSYREAVDRDPRFASAHARLAQAQIMYYYFRDRAPARLDTARAAIARAFALDSGLLEARVARGYLSWWGQLDADAALADLEAVRRQDPNNSQLLWTIANIERRRGDWLASRETTLRAFELDPRSATYALDLSTSAMVLRRYDEAMRYADRALELGPDAVAAVLQKSLLYWLKGDSLGARRVVQDARSRIRVTDILTYAIRRHPQYIPVLGGDIRDSLEAFPNTAGIDPTLLHLAKAYSFEQRRDSLRARAQYDSARVLLEPRVKAAPGEADFHSLLGLAYAGVGRRDDAVREGETAIQLLPIAREAVAGIFPLTARMRIALMVGDLDTALRHLETLLEVPSVVSKTLARVDPYFAELRDHPRFERLTRGSDRRY